MGGDRASCRPAAQRRDLFRHHFGHGPGASQLREQQPIVHHDFAGLGRVTRRHHGLIDLGAGITIAMSRQLIETEVLRLEPAARQMNGDDLATRGLVW